MKRIGIAAVILVATGSSAGADDSTTCGSAIKAPPAALAGVVEACASVIPFAKGVDLGRFLRYRGWALERLGNSKAALPDYDEALRLLPDDHWSLQGRAQARRALGDLPGAREDYQRLLAVDPSRSTLWRVALTELGAQGAPAVATAQPPAAPTPPNPPAAVVTQTELPPVRLVPPQTPAGAGAAAPAPAAPTPPPVAGATAPDPASTLRQLQSALRELGYADVRVNGRVDRATREALDGFAREEGFAVGAAPDQAMLAAAEEAVRLRDEQAAAAQKGLNLRAQQSLVDLGYSLGDIDGVLGPVSRRALAGWLASQGRASRDAVDVALVEELEEAVADKLAAAATAKPTQQFAVLESEDVGAATKEAVPASLPVTPPSTFSPGVGVERPAAPEAAAGDPAPPEAAVVAALEPSDAPRIERAPPAFTPPDRRVALVIGNSAYRNVEPLKNPRQDATDLADALRDIGFEVLQGFDLDRDAMDDLTSEFARKAEQADLALAYYSGHGLQFENQNYLVPIDGRISDHRDLRRLVQLDQLVLDTSEAGKLAVVIVDACRNDPIAGNLTKGLQKSLGASRSTALGKGLARPGELPPQTLIAYATATNSVAYDGEGRNSPYVAALLRHLKTPDLEVRLLFGKVRDDVARETGDGQWPDVYNSLGGDELFLVPGAPKPAGLELAQLTPPEVRAIQRSLQWLAFWPGPVDGQVSPGLVAAVQRWQGQQSGEQTGLLTTAQVVALHRRAARDRPAEPLPPFDDLGDVIDRSFSDAEAQRVMGMVFDPGFRGGGLDKDRSRARRFYGLAAAQGDHLAAARLGLLLTGNAASAEDRQEAGKWLEAAARAGEPAAALRLAELLIDGGGDRGRAVAWLELAAADPDTGGVAAAFLRDQGVAIPTGSESASLPD